MAYLNVVRIEEALSAMKETFGEMSECETVTLSDSVGYCLGKSIYAPENIPTFRRSMVDGYAVRLSDTVGASEQSPIVLCCIGEVEMGARAAYSIESGMAAYVPTGGEVPMGADAMVMVECTERLESDVAIFTTPRFGEHVISVGEDVSYGQCVLKKGEMIKPHHMAILASLGIAYVDVIKPPKVAILSTGDELVNIDAVPVDGQIRDCNRFMIKAVVEALGCRIITSSHVPDQEALLIEAIEDALSRADLIITSGGSSAGVKDMMQSVLDRIYPVKDKPNVFIHGLAIKPGKPTLVASIKEKPVIGLPGHPAASFMTLKALVEPFVLDWMGRSTPCSFPIECVSNFQLYAASGRDVYQLVTVSFCNESQRYIADIVYGKSSMVSALAAANAYVVISMQHEGISVGDTLYAYLL